MKITYFQDTDTLYLEFNNNPIVATQEINENTLVDLDSSCGIVIMGRLSGFSYRQVTRKLRKVGFEFYRTGKGNHEVWFNPQTRLKT